MSEVSDPKLLEALKQIFATRTDVRTIVEYQQHLYASLQELNNNHKLVHDHVRNLTAAHNRLQDDTNQMVKLRHETNDTLRSLTDAHRQTRDQISRAIEAINYVQQEVRKIPQLEDRIDRLEHDIQNLWKDDRTDDRKLQAQEQRIRKLERT